MDHDIDKLIGKLKFAVRTGRNEKGEQTDWAKVGQMAEKLRALTLALATPEDGVVTTRVLEALTLCAEFQDLSRAPEPTFFRDVVRPPEGDFDAEFDKWIKNLNIPADETPNDRRYRLRQMSWALMLYVWLFAYRSSDYLLAIRLLNRIRDFIETFKIDEFPCFGTLARWHFLYGECQRASRRFQEAEQSFLESQTLLHQRLRDRLTEYEREYEKNQLRINSEIRFSAISTARILTFLGWSEVQTGRLTRGRQLLASAATLVEGTGPDYTILFVQTRRAIGLRRMLDPDYSAAQPAFDELESLKEKYKSHTRGLVRCQLEICRGHVDVLEFGPDDQCENALARSRETLEELNRIVVPDSPWITRARLLEVRLLLLQGEVAAARSLWDQTAEKQKNPADFSSNRISVIKALLLAHEHKLIEAIDSFNEILGLIKDDPVAESECRLRLAECCIDAGADRVLVQEQLKRWSTLAPNVENGYLRQLAARVTQRLQDWQTDFVIRFKDESLNANDQTERLQRWLVKAARARLRKDATLAEIGEQIGKNQSTLSRWLNPPKKETPDSQEAS